MADIFISYSEKDRDRIAPIIRALEAKGWSTFWDWKSIPVSKTWRQIILQGLGEAKCVLVLWSEKSIDSEWVIEEAEHGKTNGILVPVRIDDVLPPIGFRQMQAANLINWTGDINNFEFKKLVIAIESVFDSSPRHVRKEKLSAEEERRLRQEEKRRRAEEESQRLEIIAEERRRLEEERQQAIMERKAEEERKRKEIEARRKTEEERKRKEAEEEAERVRKTQAERKAEAQKAAATKPITTEAAKDETKQSEPESSEPKPKIAKPPGKSPATKIGVLIALAMVFVVGSVLFFRQEPPKSRPEISAPAVKPEELRVAAKPNETSHPKKFTNSIGMEFVLIQAEAFTMGSNIDNYEKPPHNVKISQNFLLQSTEVTQGQWKKVMGDNPSFFKQCGDDCPVENVSWEDAQRFIEKLNQLEKTKFYRLPTEAEWEYACRAGTTTEYSFGDDTSKLGEYAWYFVNSDMPQRVASKNPNHWGLYDMHGNVWEWVEDDWHGSYVSAPADGRAWVDYRRGPDRVVRGGSWVDDARYCRSATRIFSRPDGRYGVGFRLSRSVALGP